MFDNLKLLIILHRCNSSTRKIPNMKTKIYNSYLEFLSREDKDENGVSPDFAKENKKFKSDNSTNKGCWNCRDCIGCRDCIDCSDCRSCRSCSDCSDCSSCSYCSSCRDCIGCRDCIDCSDCRSCRSCSDCSYCRSCSSCSYCRDCIGCRDCIDCRSCSSCSSKQNIKGNSTTVTEHAFIVPIIPNIHQKVLDAINDNGNKLEMGDWHTCETTHCRAGWVEHLAGEAGYLLAKQTSHEFAAKQIYKASSSIHVAPTRFYEDNETAMADIIRCAKEEEKISG